MLFPHTFPSTTPQSGSPGHPSPPLGRCCTDCCAVCYAVHLYSQHNTAVVTSDNPNLVRPLPPFKNVGNWKSHVSANGLAAQRKQSCCRKREQSLWLRRSPTTDILAVRYWLPGRLRCMASTGVVASTPDKLGEGGRPRGKGRPFERCSKKRGRLALCPTSIQISRFLEVSTWLAW